MTDSGATPPLMSASRGNVQIVYILYLLSFLAGFTAIIGIVIAYVSKADASDWLKSHYDFAIRTFWIGLFGWFVVFVFVCTILLIPFAFLLGLLIEIWWIIRCVQGLDFASKDQPIPKPQSWLFAS